MTAKRFSIVIDETGMECISDIVDCVDRDDFEDIVPLLNKLYDENEQLKTTIQQLQTDNTKQKKLLNTTMKENEHIKQTIKDMINTERTEIGKMTLRQLWRQIQ